MALAGVTALALAQAPTQAAELLGVTIGGGGGTVTNTSAMLGNTQASASLGLGGSSTANLTANANTTAGSIAPQALSANAVIDLGGSDDLFARVDINGDGVIDSEDTALLKLDVNGDGVLNILDDVNGDGLLSDADVGIRLNGGENALAGNIGVDLGNGTDGEADLRVGLPSVGSSIADLGEAIGGIDLGNIDVSSRSVGAIGLAIGSELPGGGEVPPPSVVPAPDQTLSAIRRLDNNEIPALKLKCIDVLRDPGSFDAATVNVCRVLASL